MNPQSTDGKRVDCRCPRAKHKHGTIAAYQRDRCRCFHCRLSMWNANATSSYRNGDVFIPRTGTIRRLQALHAVGWSGADIARALGVTKQAVLDLRRNPSPVILTYTAVRVETVYNALWDATPAPTWQTERTKRWAARNGWLPPMAWDDDTIDEIDAPIYKDTNLPGRGGIIDETAVSEAITGRRVTLTSAELTHAVKTMTRMGFSAKQISDRLGTTSRQVTRKRAAA